jgi:hypothetical protein
MSQQPSLSPNAAASWWMIGEILTALGGISVGAVVLGVLTPQQGILLVTILSALGVAGKTITTKLSTPQGRQQIAITQQDVIAVLEKFAAMPPAQQQSILANLPAFLALAGLSSPSTPAA